MTLLPVRSDPEDGGPAWDPPRGGHLVPGQLAWEELAVGHHCQTWLCWSAELWQPTLVKVVRPGWSRPRWTRALGREARALRAVRHPAFPRLLGNGTPAPLPHLVLEFLDGPALDEVLDEDGPLPDADVARLGTALLSGLRGLHATGHAHLDICPDNVLLVDRRARLVDLGASRPLGHVLRRGEEVGTDGFVAPELAAARGGAVTAAMDVYGVGATLRAVLEPGTGSLDGVLDALTAQDPAARPTVDQALRLLVRRTGPGAARSWPRWADRELSGAAGVAPPRRARRTAGSPREHTERLAPAP